MVAAQSASLLAASALFQHRGPACDLPATIPVADDETQRGTVYAATLMVEGYHLAMDEARVALRDFTTAVADQQFSDQAQIADATRLAHTAALLSRAWIAHLDVGGTEGLPALPVVDGAGFCPEPRMAPEAERALELIRIAAPPPEVILATDTYDMGDLWTGWGTTNPLAESLRGRLSVLLSAPDLRDASPAAIYERFGLPEAAFIEARTHLVREIHAFGRSLDHPMPPDPIAGDRTSADSMVDLFATTRNPPSPAHSAYFTAIARFDTLQLDAPTPTRPSYLTRYFGDVIPGTSFSRFRSSAHFVDYLTTATTGLLLRADLGVPGITPLDADSAAVLGGFASDAGQQRTARAQVCSRKTGANEQVELRIWGIGSAPSTSPGGPATGFGNPLAPLLVRGRDGLECATRGAVEGAPCELADYVVATTAAPATPGAFDGFRELLVLTVTNISDLQPDPRHVNEAALAFLVTRRAGTALPNGTAGTYDAVTGFFVPRPAASAPNGWRCDTIPVVPHLEEETSDALAPSTTYCAMSAETCAGLPLDGPIPLENELTEDFDPVESSWRHYLRLAQQAADHADALGEDLVRSGLEMDMRAEAAIDELETLCGVSLNIDDLTSPMAGMTATGTACDATTPCPAGYRCTDGSCVVDPVQVALASAATDADRQRLIECLGDDTVVPWVTLGHDPLCLWWDGNDPSTICAEESPERPCPYLGEILTRAPGMPATSTCDPSKVPVSAMGATYVPIAVPEALGFFVAHEDPPPRDDGPDPSDVPCGLLANMRLFRPAAEEVDALMASSAFQPHNLRPLAERLSWRPAPGDYSSVLLDDATWLSTGSQVDGPGPRWPCGMRDWFDQCPTLGMATADPTADGPLFCIDMRMSPSCSPSTAYEHEARLARARMNDLLARAVLAARIVSGASLRGLYVPFYARSQDERLSMPGDEGDWRTDPRHDGARIFSSGSGVLRIENLSDVIGSSTDFPFFDMGGARAYEVTGAVTAADAVDHPHCAAIPAGAEWSSCPWDFTFIPPNPPCIEIFDDAPDCDDRRTITDAYHRQFRDGDVGLIARALTDASDGDDVTRAVDGLWARRSVAGASTRALIARVLDANDARAIAIGPGIPADVEDLTRYWQRSMCGRVNHHNCGGSRHVEMNRAAQASSSCWSLDPTLPGNGVSGCDTNVGCFARYADCVATVEAHGIEFEETFDGNRAFIASRGLTHRDVLNGLELMCAAARRDIPGGIDCSRAPEIRDVSDLFAAAEHLDCMAARIETSASQVVLRDFPARAVQLMRSGGGSGVYGSVSGEYAAAVSELRAALIELADLGESMSSTTRSMAASVREVRAEVGRYELQTEIADWQLASTTASQITSCAVAVASAWSDMSSSFSGSGLAVAGATCVNSGVQIGIAARITDLQQESDQLAIQQAFARFEREFTMHARSLSGSQAQLRATLERIEAARTRIENLQSSGRRALARALFLDSDDTGRQYSVNTALRRRHNTLALRYQQAHRRGVRLAYLAKRALEQRLGMELDRMTAPLPLLDEPPADWHMDVCSMSGIDYDRIRSARPGETGERTGDDSPLSVPEDYAGEYLGDYVRRLELVFESYSLAFPFQAGTDTAVLSARDELWRVRAPCSVEVPNLLYEAGHLDIPPSTDGTRTGWYADACRGFAEWPPDESGRTDPPPQPNCASAVPLEQGTDEGPIPPTAVDFGRVGGFRVEFGDAIPPTYPDGTIVMDGAAPATSLTADTRLVQWVVLDPGRYRVSWYARELMGAAAVPPSEAVRTFRNVLVPDPVTGELVSSVEPLAMRGSVVGPISVRDGWGRYYFFVDVPRASTVGVAVVPAFGGGGPRYRVADVAALMLEDVTATVVRDPAGPAAAPDGTSSTVAETSPPAPFFDTDQTRARELEVCEDITGSTFRRRAWTRGCARLCPDGYGGDCGPLAAETHCYYETSFTLDPESLERAGLLGGGGLAFGNYNYRVDALGVNIVGTGVRDCSATGGPTPSTCYASGNIAYSMIHQGPYWVRNHTGGLYSAPLFTGRIERARALAAERYVTNPLSSADRSLIEPYLRSEFRGRPMPGTYLLRIWDDPALRFDRIEDVQIVLNYRYWTRQE